MTYVMKVGEELYVEFDAKTKCCAFAISFLLPKITRQSMCTAGRAELLSDEQLYSATVWNSRLQASQGHISRKCSKL